MDEGRTDLFDFAALAARRDRAMRAGFAGGGDFLWREVARLLAAPTVIEAVWRCC